MIRGDFDALTMNIKFFGYQMARRLAHNLPHDRNLAARHVGLPWKPSTQADLESDWAAYWCQELKTPVVFHRKLWEFAYVLQAMHEHGVLRTGARGLGFGCGEEPLPSYLASRGVDVTVTDLSLEDSQAAGWAATGQHTSELERAFQSHLVSRELFDRHVELRQVDMRQIPTTLRDYDFCWSVCALEHLGSIEQGLRFVEAAMDVLKPGGVAVHTTEFNFLDDEKTIDNWPTVLFQRRHFEALHASLQTAGYRVTPLDFDVGAKPMDQFVDVPPFLHDWGDQLKGQWGAGCDHLKLLIDGYASTCFGVVVVKP